MNKFSLLTIVSVLTLVMVCGCGEKKVPYIHDTGFVFGTAYSLKYQSTESQHNNVRAALDEYDKSLSTYNDSSIISKINRNEPHKVDSFFVTVWNKAKEMNELSDGAFDVTVRGLSSHWRFAKEYTLDTISVAIYDSLLHTAANVLKYTGMDKVNLEGECIVKDDPRIQIDMCALAEGYGIDVAASVLEKNGIENYMVEIGGELHLKGLSPSGTKWRIAIDSPTEDNSILERISQHIIEITDCSISTSGSYRQYYYTEDGKRISHTINPKTGRPIEHKCVSVSVIASNTMTTDALATIFMVIGPDKALEMANKLDGVEALIIYEGEDDQLVEVMTDGFRKVIVQ